MEDPGLIFLTFEELFQRIKSLEGEKIFEVSITYLEIYNETIRDLLVPGGSTKVLNLREDANKQISVAGLSSHTPESVQHVMEMILMGNGNRTISPTEANAVSSRSHAVLQVNISQKARTANISEDHTMATLSIIDLAGSERASVTKNRGERLLEGANINRSLLALGNCINALCDPHRKNHIPYRDSKLTRLLKFSLGGNCRTVMVVCVSPSSAHYDETHNTLKYGNRAKNIKTKISRNTMSVDRHVGQYVKIIYDLRQEVEELKRRAGSHSVEDNLRVEREQKLTSLKYDEAMNQLRSAFEQHSAARLRRPEQISKLRELGLQINTATAWLSAWNIAFESADHQEGLEDFRSARDRTMRLLRDLEQRREALEHELDSCQTLAAIDTVTISLLRNNKGETNRVLCKAIDAEATALKNKVLQESFEAEMLASKTGLIKTKQIMQETMLTAFQSASCLNTDGGQEPEEVERYNAIYQSTYKSALATLTGLVEKDFAVYDSMPRSHHTITFPRTLSPSRSGSPLRLHARRLSVSSSPRPSPRAIRVKSHRPGTVFAKKKTLKKSVQWADAQFGSPKALPAEKQFLSTDSLSKRRSLVPIASPPNHKRSRLSVAPECGTLKVLDSNTDVNTSPTDPDCSAALSTDDQNEESIKQIRDFRRPSSSQSNHTLTKPAKTALSGLALANVVVDLDSSRRVSREKENDRPLNIAMRSTSSSLSNPLRQSLAGRSGKAAAWR